MTLYKTKNGQQTGFVPGVGAIVDGQIDSPVKLESSNLEEVKVEETPTPTDQSAAPAAPAASPTPTPAPAAVPETPPAQNTNIAEAN